MAGHLGNDALQDSMAVLTIVVQWNKAMAKVKFCTVACLTTLKVGRPDLIGPGNSERGEAGA